MKRVPLTWLQAFEAAGRTGSFKAAAQELNVSPSNISHQIRDLEAYLGTLLFSRQGGQVVLTEEGQNYLPALTEGFQRIRQASLHGISTPKHLHLGAFPFLANEIIAPNLDSLKNLLPETEIRIWTHTELPALTHINPEQRLDVVIRYGSGRFPGMASRKLFDVELVPVAGSAVPRITSAADLLQQPLLRVIGPFQGWEHWLARFSRDTKLPDFVLETDSFHAAMLAVERGEGICLGVLPYLKPWIRNGRVRAFEEFSLPIEGQAAYAVYAPYQQGNPVVERFLEWLGHQLA